MNPVHKERIAFWGEVLVAGAMTVVSILVASRLGYREAVRFARFEDLRAKRNLMQAIERELASNEQAMRNALEDWGGEDFRYLHVVTGAHDRARESDVWFQLSPETTGALSGVYTARLKETIAGIRKNRGGPVFRLYAITVRIYLEKIEKARPLLQRDIAAVEAELAGAGYKDLAPAIEWPAAPVIESTAEESEIAAMPATPGWERAEVVRYQAALKGLSIGRNVAVSARPRGPVLLVWRVHGFPPEGRKPVRLWLCFLPRLPITGSVFPGEQDDLLRRFHSLDPVEGAFGVTRPIEAWEGEVVDPNQPCGWKWVYGLIEDDAGERHFVWIEAWKVGKENSRTGWKKPGEKASVLPRGYLK